MEKTTATNKIKNIPTLPESEFYSEEELLAIFQELLAKKEELIEKSKEILNSGTIHTDANEMMDEVDQAATTIDQDLTVRLLDRDRKLLGEIERAIDKIKNGDYGYCEGTGEPIPKRRLELRPWTRYSVKYKEQLEKTKKSGRGFSEEEM